MKENQFLDYKTCLLLQKVGYNQKGFAWYNYEHLRYFGNDDILDRYAGETNRPLASTITEAIQWLITKGLFVEIKCESNAPNKEFRGGLIHINSTHKNPKHSTSFMPYKKCAEVLIRVAASILADQQGTQARKEYNAMQLELEKKKPKPKSYDNFYEQ